MSGVLPANEPASGAERGEKPGPQGEAPLSPFVHAVRAVAQAVSAAPGALDPIAIAQDAVHALARATGLASCCIYMADRSAGVARCVAQTGFPAQFLEQFGTLPLDGELLTARAIRTGKPQYTGVAQPLPATRAVMEVTGGDTFLIVPFHTGGEVIGTVNAVGSRPAPPSADEVALLQVVADQLGHAVRAAELYQAREASDRRARFLAAVSRAFNATLDLEQVLSDVAQRATEVLGEWCIIYLRCGDLMEMRAVHHQDERRVQIMRDVFAREPVRVGEGVAGTVVLTFEPQIFHEFDEAAIQRLAPRDVPEYVGELRQVRSWACLPLVSHGEGLGALVVATVTRPLQEVDLEFASAFAEIAAGAIANARLFENERTAHAFADAARRRLEEADRQKDEFLSIASHELRTPLTSAQGFTQLLLRRALGQPEPEPRLTDALETIETQLRRMGALLNELLDFSRLQLGPLPLHAAPLDLCALVREIAAQTLATRADAAGRVQITTPPEPLVGNWDRFRIEQVLVNLLDNALKYSPHGGPIDVTVARDGDAAIVRVRDRGLGVPPEAVAHLFQRFYRIPDTAHQAINGLGIGLYICREIVERHGGSIAVEQPDGPGAAFVVRLPLRG